MAVTGTDLQISTDATFSSIVIDESTAYAVSRAFVQDELPYGQTLYARVRHTDDTYGTSAWSSTSMFQVIQPASVIGVCLDNSTTKGNLYWIDEYGNQVTSFSFQDHGVYQGIKMVIEDAERTPVTMTQLPLFYIRTAASGPSGTFSTGLKCWWISDIETTGFRPHPTFKRTTNVYNDKYMISSNVKIGTYLAHSETVGTIATMGSASAQTVATGNNKATMKQYIINRNNSAAGISGFRMFDIWDMSALRFLLMIAKANTDGQKQWGDNEEGTTSPKTGTTNARACFQGTHNVPIVHVSDLWRCYWYHADGITISDNVLTLTNPMDLTSSLVFDDTDTSRYTQCETSGWIRDVLDCPMTIGDDTHDLMELFIASEVVSSVDQATFSDYHHPGSGTLAWVTVGGGASQDNRYWPNSDTVQGLFYSVKGWCDSWYYDNTDYNAVRISKS